MSRAPAAAAVDAGTAGSVPAAKVGGGPRRCLPHPGGAPCSTSGLRRHCLHHLRTRRRRKKRRTKIATETATRLGIETRTGEMTGGVSLLVVEGGGRTARIVLPVRQRKRRATRSEKRKRKTTLAVAGTAQPMVRAAVTAAVGHEEKKRSGGRASPARRSQGLMPRVQISTQCRHRASHQPTARCLSGYPISSRALVRRSGLERRTARSWCRSSLWRGSLAVVAR
mmetsp:Transcript_36882/g.102370  ORF Transcript_36882/g.102370 Transcript_36882/m.102370 type:complete len:225 (+) Transcript_36882:228-902(+)